MRSRVVSLEPRPVTQGDGVRAGLRGRVVALRSDWVQI